MDFQNLLQIMETLRSEKGCPWDKEQTRETLKLFILEEAYEVIDAIDGNNPEQIKEELGDLLFQIIFQSQIAKEKGEFSFSDVIDKICNKMVTRHPHVFGKADYKTTDEVLLNWEKQKRLEGKLRESVLEGIPDSLPSLLRAYKLQHRAAKVGFDWEKIEHVIEKLDEEIKEFKDAIKAEEKEGIEDELGDILFMLVNVARFIDVNPEEALRKTIYKFISRFRYIEMSVEKQGKSLEDMSLGEMDKLWDEAKREKR